MNDEVTIVRDRDNEVRFSEEDVRQACRMMMCGDHVDDCITLMKRGDMECALCYAVLQARKRPFRIWKRESRSQRR